MSSSVTVAPADARTALHEYRQRNRRLMRWYAVAIALVLLVVAAGVKFAYAHGELTKVSRQSAPAPTPVAPAPTKDALTLAWHSTDRPATGSAYDDGIVVTYAGSTVNGRDALTGAVRWHYTRSDRALCTVVQQSSSTIAIYRRGANCDEVTGFTTATGVPKFYRTLPDNGTPAVTSAPNVVLLATPAAVHVFDNASGIDRWTWPAPTGCSVDQALAGGLGILISAHCGGQHQLLLHSITGKDPTWTVTVPGALIPVQADAFIGAVNPTTGLVSVFSGDKGVITGSFSVGSAPVDVAVGLTAQTGVSALVGSTSYGFIQLGSTTAVTSPDRRLWTSAVGSPLAVRTNSALAVTEGGGVSELDAANGKLVRSLTLTPALAPAAAQAVTEAIGSGLLVAGVDVAYYR